MKKNVLRTILLLLVCYFSGSVCLGQETAEDKQYVLLAEAFSKIKKQFDCDIVYRDELIQGANKVTLAAMPKGLEEAVKFVIKQSGLSISYKIIEKVVILSKKIVQEPTVKQFYEVKGTVKDKTGGAIPGVTILVEGTASGTVTGVDGRFQINVPAKDVNLVFTFVGMKSEKVTFTGQTTIDVVMEEDNEQLGEVVVTGYQVIDKRVLTSSIETIKAEELDKVGALTVDQMLEGKAAGLMVTNLSSTPGAAAKIRVRSAGTFTGSRAPLWVVDGMIYEDPVPLSAEDINSFDRVNLIGNALTGLNPQDIETINILKDASATAIYGTRAANGVIVITTKRGKEGKAAINYSGSLSIVDRPHYSNFNLMNSKERVDVSREIAARNLGYPNDIFTYVGYEKAMRDYKLGLMNHAEFQSEVSRLETMNTDWFGELFRPAMNQSHTMNLAGGSDKTRYYFSVGYNDNKGTEKGVDLQRVTARANIDVKLRENVTIAMGMSGSVQDAIYNHSSINLFDEAYYNSRTTPVYNEDGSLFFVENKLMESGSIINVVRYNVLQEANQSEKSVTNKDFDINAQLSWDIIKGIKLQASGSYRSTTNLQEEWITENTAYVAKLRTYDGVEDAIDDWVKRYATVPFGGLYSGAMTSQTSLRGQVQLNLSKVIAQNHVFNLNLGYEANSNKYRGSNGWTSPGYNHEQGRSFIALPQFQPNPSFDLSEYDYPNMIRWLSSGSSMDMYPTVVDQLKNQISMFGIFNYSYNNRYVLNFNIRSDGSNQFGQYARYKFKPTWSVSGRWNVHSESFWNQEGRVEELALRVSYGFRGNPPSTLPYMIIKDYVFSSDFNEDKANMSSFPNSNLTWEKTATLNLGLNYSFFGGRLSGAFDFAYSHGTDLLLSRPVSLVNGQATQQYNGGEKKDYNYEFSVSATPIKKKHFGWRLSANISFNKEEILAGFEGSKRSDYNVSDYLNGNIYLTGFPVDGFYSFQFDGLNEEGLPSFKNLEEEYGSIQEAFKEILTYSGRRSPKVYGGFSTEVQYKRLSCRASFSYKFGHHTRRLKLYQGTQNLPMPHENMNSEFNNRWRKPGDEAWAVVPGLSNNTMNISASGLGYYKVQYSEIVPAGGNGYSLYDLSDLRVVNGSHIRCQSISISYSLADRFSKSIGLNNVRFSGSVSNVGVWAFDKKLKGQDPEQVQGIGMPALPTYSFSLSFGI